MPSKGHGKDFGANKLILLILPMSSRYRPLRWSWGDSNYADLSRILTTIIIY